MRIKAYRIDPEGAGSQLCYDSLVQAQAAARALSRRPGSQGWRVVQLLPDYQVLELYRAGELVDD